jgi:hypothetical protein
LLKFQFANAGSNVWSRAIDMRRLRQATSPIPEPYVQAIRVAAAQGVSKSNNRVPLGHENVAFALRFITNQCLEALSARFEIE